MELAASVEQFLRDEISAQALSKPLSDSFSEDVITRLIQEIDRYWGIDPSHALELAERIVTIGRTRGDADQTALGIMTRGDALKFLGRTEEAWEALEQAGRMFLETGNEIGWARTRSGRLYLSTMLNRVEEALVEAERARDILIRSDEKDKLLRILFNIAYVHNYLGRPREALIGYRNALTIAEELGEAGETYFGPLYLNLGSTFELLGEIHNAQNNYEHAHRLLETKGETYNLARVEANLGYLAQSKGNYRQALQLLNRSLERVDDHFQLEATKIKWHLLDCYLGLNRSMEARELAHQVIADYRELKDAFELARALLLLGTIEAELDNMSAAQGALEEAEEIFSSLGAGTRRAQVWLRRGRIALQQGEFESAHHLALQAGEQFGAAGQKANEAEANLLEGQALYALEDFQSAAIASKIALQTAQADNIPSLRYSAHLLLGRLCQRQSGLNRAKRHFQAATATVERIQRGLTITLQPGFLEDKGEAWRALIKLQLNQERIETAFETLERAKSQVVLGYLANHERLRWARDDAHSRALIEELEHLRGEHRWFYRLAHESSHNQGHTNSIAPGEALGEVKHRERRMRAITEQLYLQSAEGQAFNSAPTPRVEDIHATLDEDSLLIEYYHDGEQVWAFTLDAEGIEVQRLPINLATLTQLLRQLQVNLAAALKVGSQASTIANLTGLAQTILKRMHAGLIEPLALEYRGKARLFIVPYGPLHYLPFHLLFDGTGYLIEDHEVVILPAAGLVTRPGPRCEPGALVLAHSWEGRLPLTAAEGERVQELFGGKLYIEQDARRSALQSAPRQILHIAAHGEYRLDQPDLSFIELADGQMYADDLFQQDLSYELVTLSACETGRANVSGGDELIGLGRGFLYAGAGALVLSLWKVSEVTTTRLMTGMYKALRGGASKAAALREAQQTILTDIKRQHPAYWGAFQLVGDPAPLSI